MRLGLGLGLSRAGASAAPTGNWYEADAIFAWDSTSDLDSAQIDPVFGAAIPLVTGTGAAIASGLWDMDSNVYRDTGSVMTSALNSTMPILVATVLDKDNQSASFVSIMQVGSVNFIRFFAAGSVQPRFDWYNGTTVNIRCSEAAMAAGAKVYWAFYDPATTQLRGGINQTENTTHGPVAFTYTADSSRGITIGGQDTIARSAMKHGSMQVVNRAGMTLTDALAIVQKMQTLHGI